MGHAAGPAPQWVQQLGAGLAAKSANMSFTAPGYPKAWPAFPKAEPKAVAAKNAAEAKATEAKAQGPRRWNQAGAALPKEPQRPPTPPIPAASVTAGQSGTEFLRQDAASWLRPAEEAARDVVVAGALFAKGKALGCRAPEPTCLVLDPQGLAPLAAPLSLASGPPLAQGSASASVQVIPNVAQLTAELAVPLHGTGAGALQAQARCEPARGPVTNASIGGPFGIPPSVPTLSLAPASSSSTLPPLLLYQHHQQP